MPLVASPEENPNSGLDIDLPLEETIPPFPHPSVFTFLPDIYLIISRLSLLKASQNNLEQSRHDGMSAPLPSLASQPSQPLTAPTSAPSQNQLTMTISHESRESNSSRSGEPTAAANATIEVKDLPTQVYAVRQAILHAKEVVRSLPDIRRSIEDQESEIKRLEGQITALNNRLGLLGELARSGDSEEDVIMQGIEG